MKQSDSFCYYGQIFGVLIVTLMMLGGIYLIPSAWGVWLVGACFVFFYGVTGREVPSGALGRIVMHPLIGIFCVACIFFASQYCFYQYNLGCERCVFPQSESLILMGLNLLFLGGFIAFCITKARLWSKNCVQRVFCRWMSVGMALFWGYQVILYIAMVDDVDYTYPWLPIVPFFKEFSIIERQTFAGVMLGISLIFVITACCRVIRYTQRAWIWVFMALFMTMLTGYHTFYLFSSVGGVYPWTGHVFLMVCLLLTACYLGTGTILPAGLGRYVMAILILILLIGNMIVWGMGGGVLSLFDVFLNGIGVWIGINYIILSFKLK